MRYIMSDTGEIFDVKSSKEFVKEMRETSWEQGASLDAWMKNTASRFTESMGVKIDASTCDTFVQSLVACGLAKEKPDEE